MISPINCKGLAIKLIITTVIKIHKVMISKNNQKNIN